MLPWNKRLLKKADRFLIPWLRAYGRLSPAQGDDRGLPVRAIKRILIIRPGGLGDAVLTFPMIGALKDHFPAVPMDVLAEKRNGGIYRLNNYIRRIYYYDKRHLGTWLKLKRTSYDLIMDTEQFHHLSAFMANRLGPSYVCGFASPSRSPFLTHAVSYDADDYEAVSFLNLAQAAIGHPISFNPEASFIDIPSPLQDWADKRLLRIKHPTFITLFPGATAEGRMWPIVRYKRIVRWLALEGISVVVIGGKDAIGISDRLAQGFHQDEVLNLAGRTTLPQTAALIQKARAHLSADTGVLHVAYGVGTPTVSLFGPGLYKKWGPRGNRHVVVRTGMPCSPCTVDGEIPPCPFDAACIKQIETDAVKKALKEVLFL